VTTHVANTPRGQSDRQRPSPDRQDVDAGDRDEPEPDEDVDLLVEQIDRQDALNGVPMNVAELQYLEVA